MSASGFRPTRPQRDNRRRRRQRPDSDIRSPSRFGGRRGPSLVPNTAAHPTAGSPRVARPRALPPAAKQHGGPRFGRRLPCEDIGAIESVAAAVEALDRARRTERADGIQVDGRTEVSIAEAEGRVQIGGTQGPGSAGHRRIGRRGLRTAIATSSGRWARWSVVRLMSTPSNAGSSGIPQARWTLIRPGVAGCQTMAVGGGGVAMSTQAVGPTAPVGKAAMTP